MASGETRCKCGRLEEDHYDGVQCPIGNGLYSNLRFQPALPAEPSPTQREPEESAFSKDWLRDAIQDVKAEPPIPTPDPPVYSEYPATQRAEKQPTEIQKRCMELCGERGYHVPECPIVQMAQREPELGTCGHTTIPHPKDSGCRNWRPATQREEASRDTQTTCGCYCYRCRGGSHCVRCPGYTPGMPAPFPSLPTEARVPEQPVLAVSIAEQAFRILAQHAEQGEGFWCESGGTIDATRYWSQAREIVKSRAARASIQDGKGSK